MERIWTDNAEDEGKVQTTNSNGGENHSGKKIPSGWVRIPSPGPFFSLSVSLNIREHRDKIATYLRVIGEIGSEAWL